MTPVEFQIVLDGRAKRLRREHEAILRAAAFAGWTSTRKLPDVFAEVLKALLPEEAQKGAAAGPTPEEEYREMEARLNERAKRRPS